MHGIELFERARDAGGRLLSVERLPGVDADEQVSAGLVLVFDVGRILMATDGATGRLHALHLEDAEEVPSAAVSAIEDEPWWRLLGCPLASASVEDDGRVLRLGLRIGDEVGRFVTLTAEGEAVRTALAAGPN